MTQIRSGQVRRGRSDGILERGEIRVGQVGSGQVGVVELHTVQLHVRQVHILERTAGEIGLTAASDGQIRFGRGLAEHIPGQVCAVQIGVRHGGAAAG